MYIKRFFVRGIVPPDRLPPGTDFEPTTDSFISDLNNEISKKEDMGERLLHCIPIVIAGNTREVIMIWEVDPDHHRG